MIVVLTADAAFFTPFEELRHAHTARSFGLYGSNILFAIRCTDSFASDVVRDPLLHTWSLSVEEQFYLIYAPLVALIAMRVRGMSRFNSFFRNAGVVLSLASFAGCLFLRRMYPVIAFYVLPARAWEFGIGALAVIVVRRLPSRPIRHAQWISALSFIVLVASGLLTTERVSHPGWITLLPTLATAGIMISGARGVTVIGGLLSSEPLRFIGRLSYSWYLWHWPFLVFFAETVPHPSPTASLIVVIAALIPAAATYYLVEKPVRFPSCFNAAAWPRSLARSLSRHCRWDLPT
ncbi:MAG: acyltransferase 3 [Gemmatimonadetes bacterium]|nr:acyltransferase 3 [Gemmatimonadota bacterium]